MIQILCDGCGKMARPGHRDIALTGERSNGFGGGGMPDKQFHLCEDCGRAAFAALPKWRRDKV